MVRVIKWVLTVVACVFAGALLLGLAIGEAGQIIGVITPMSLSGLGAAALWIDEAKRRRAARAVAAGRCQTCGYSRTGLAPDAPCPECGTRPTRG